MVKSVSILSDRSRTHFIPNPLGKRVLYRIWKQDSKIGLLKIEHFNSTLGKEEQNTIQTFPL